MEGALHRFLDSDIFHSFKQLARRGARGGDHARGASWPRSSRRGSRPHNPFDLRTLNLLDAFTPPAWTDRGNPALPARHRRPGPRRPVDDHLRLAHVARRRARSPRCSRWSIGVTLGLVSGYVGGKVDAFIMRVADVQLSFPAILIALLIDGVARVALPKESHDQVAVYVLILAIARLGLGRLRADRARLHARRAQQGVRAGRARHRPPPGRDHVLPRPAERAGAGAGARHAADRRGDHHRVLALLPRAWACRRRSPRSAR